MRRATRAAAAAPNNKTIGGAGTGVPPLVLVELLLDEELALDEEELEELDVDVEPPLVEVEAVKITLPLDPPKKPPLKKPPPKPAALPPLEPPTMTGGGAPMDATSIGGGGAGG